MNGATRSVGRSRRLATILAAGAIAAMAAAACGGQKPAIEYSIWGDPSELQSQQAIVDVFKKANPDIDVKVTVSDWSTYWDKLQTGLAGGAAPDVFAMDGPLFPDYQARDVLLDLKPYIDKDGYDLSKLVDLAVKDFTTPNGGQYGLPRDLNSVVLYYNKAMFDEAGVAYPDDTWTWDDLIAAGKQLTKDKDGDKTIDQWGLYTETTDMENYWSSLVWQNGGDVLAPDGKTTVLDSAEAKGGLQFLQDLIYKEKIMPEPALFAETGDAFEQGQAAMEANGSWLVPTLLNAGIDLGIAPLPAGPAGKVTSLNPTGAVVHKKSKNPEAAWKFVKFLTSPEAQQMLMQLKAALPIDKSVLAGPYASSFDGAQIFADSIAYGRIKPSFKGYDEFTTTLQAELDTNVFNAPNKTAGEAIDAVVGELNAILAKQ